MRCCKKSSRSLSHLLMSSCRLSNASTSGQSNLTKRPHRRRTRTARSYSPDGANTPCNTSVLGPIRVHSPNGFSIGSAIFAQLTAECRRACPGMSFALKLPLLSGAPSNTWFLDPTRAHNPNGISIGSADFAGLTTVTGGRVVRRCMARHRDGSRSVVAVAL